MTWRWLVPHAVNRRSSTTLLIAFLLVALGTNRTTSGRVASAPPPQAGAGNLDACSLLTRAEVQTATKKSVLTPAKSQVANMASCGFGEPKDATSKVVDLNVVVAANAADARRALSIAKSNAADVQPVSGLGDEAYWDKFLRTLRVAKGRYQLDFVLDSDAGGVETAKTLAAKALSRLPV
jgi:hypothetical protein